MAIGCVSPEEEAMLYPAMKSNQRRSNCTIKSNLRMQTLLKPVTIILFKGVSLSKFCCFYRIPESKFWSGWTSGVARPGEIWLVEVIQTPSPSPQRCFILWDESTWRILTCNLIWYKPAKTGMAAYKKMSSENISKEKTFRPTKKVIKVEPIYEKLYLHMKKPKKFSHQQKRNFETISCLTLFTNKHSKFLLHLVKTRRERNRLPLSILIHFFQYSSC